MQGSPLNIHMHPSNSSNWPCPQSLRQRAALSGNTTLTVVPQPWRLTDCQEKMQSTAMPDSLSESAEVPSHGWKVQKMDSAFAGNASCRASVRRLRERQRRRFSFVVRAIAESRSFKRIFRDCASAINKRTDGARALQMQLALLYLIVKITI